MLHFDKNPFNLKELCYSVEMMFYHPITEKKLLYGCIIDDNVPEIIIGDKERLTQILNNLINNSIKFTAAGSITLQISLIETTANTARLCFSVKDTGIGIATDKLETIFERFEQGETSTTRTYGGTGLGLSIVKKLATLQGGSIKAKSETGHGSEFIVEIPFVIGKEDKFSKIKFESPNNICPVNENTAFPNLKILAAEDNKMNRTLLSYIFQQWQLTHDFAENGQIALEMLEKNNYNLILMDIQMPVVDGYTATKKIRQDLKLDIPIIAMTANVLPGEKEKCQQLGMNDYISKPLNENILYDLLLKYTIEQKQHPIEKMTGGAYINLNHLERIYGGNKKFIAELIGQFLQQFPAEIEQLSEAVIERDYNSVVKQSHNMKTTVTYVNNNTPMLEYLSKIETAQNIPTGWEIIQHSMNRLLENKDQAIDEATHCLQKISS
jgi:CheY-like chemotaxis protein